MYDYHRRWEGHDLYLAEGRVAADLGVEPQSRELFFGRFRYRPDAATRAPPSPYFLPTMVMRATIEAPEQPGMMSLVIADCVERYRNTILQVYQRAFREKSAVLWQSFRSTPRSNTYPHEFRRLYSQQPADWWINATHLTLLGAAFTQRRALGATVVEALCMSLGLSQDREVAIRQFLTSPESRAGYLTGLRCVIRSGT